MAAETVGFFLVCECGVQVFVPDRALACFTIPPSGTFTVSCPMCVSELYRFVNGGQIDMCTKGDDDSIPASPEVQQYHAKQGREWGRPS